jgi:hypothetical protein
MRHVAVACFLAAIAMTAPSLAAGTPSPAADVILQETLHSYSVAKDPVAVQSVASWCHDQLIDLNFPRTEFILKRAAATTDQAKAAALLALWKKLSDLDEQEAALLCLPGALE